MGFPLPSLTQSSHVKYPKQPFIQFYVALMKAVNDILKEINNRQFKPVYVFDGEEAYYIDQLTHAFENHALEPHEKDFNQSVFYGKDADWTDVVNECRSYPAFAQRRLVILKEAAQMKKITELEAYISNPSKDTILVIAHKHKKLDGRTSLYRAIKKQADYHTFEKIKEYHLTDWILNFCITRNLKINQRNAELLGIYLGNDLQKIVNELEKVMLNIHEGEEITEELIEKYIGISKDYNVFQYPTAILERNGEKAFKVVNYFMANPKDAPMVVVTATLYGQFCKLYQYHYAKSLGQKEIAAALKIAPFFVKDYDQASRKFSLIQTTKAIQLIHEYNLKSIGIDVAHNDISLLKELTAKLLVL